MSKYPTTNIVYSGLEDKGGPTVTILDENKNKWTIWKADYDHKDQDSEAYGSLKNFKIGESFGIEYGEKEESFTPNDGPNRGKSIRFTRRTIYKILPLVSHPTTVTSQSPKSSNVGHPRASERGFGVIKDSVFFERVAYEKCCSLWAGQILGQTSDLPQGYARAKGFIELGDAYKLFQAIKADGAKRFSERLSGPGPATNLISPDIQEMADQMREDLPTIHVDDDVNVERIPF